MDRMQMALNDAKECHLGTGTTENLRGALNRILDFDPRLRTPIPPAKREITRQHFERHAEAVFHLGFEGRYADRPKFELQEEFDLEIMRLRTAIHGMVEDWDRFQTRQRQPSKLTQTYPQSSLHRKVARVLADIFQAGQREGYIARKRRVAEEVAQGMHPNSALALLQQEAAAHS